MKPDRDQDLQLLGEFLDGELDAPQAEDVRARLERDSDFARLRDALFEVSSRARACFGSHASALPDLADSRDAFVRTTLASPHPSGRPPSRRRVLLLAATFAMVVAAGAIWWWWDGEPPLGAALDGALEPCGPVLLELRRAGLLSEAGSLEVRYGRGRQWLVTAREFVLMPKALRLPTEGPVLRAAGRTIRVGSDGQELWLHVEGEAQARARPAEIPGLGLRALSAFVAEGGLERTPATGWPAVVKILGRARAGTLALRGRGWEEVGGESVYRFEGEDRDLTVRLWVAERGLARAAFGLVDLTLQRARDNLPEAAYGWRHWLPR